MPKISLLSILSALWLAIIGLMAIYAVGMFVLSAFPLNSEPTRVGAMANIPGVTAIALFGAVTCLAAVKQIRKPAPKWVMAALAIGITFFIVHLASTLLVTLPKITVPVVSEFLIEEMLKITAGGIAILIALFALPLAYNLFMRRAPS